jgi:hypothetical protein
MSGDGKLTGAGDARGQCFSHLVQRGLQVGARDVYPWWSKVYMIYEGARPTDTPAQHRSWKDALHKPQ